MALADPVRRAIVARLSRGPATVNELAAPFDITKQAVSKHIQVLEQAGLVTRTRDAQRRPVHLDPACRVGGADTHLMLRDHRSIDPDSHQPWRVTTLNRHEGSPFA